ncbi:MAG: TIGR04100 family radical SAM protein [Clostridia bacterium]|nr:TIGR04100 family radical SAM protein [Clostridia bacterium]
MCIAYKVHNNLYINLTNRCSCACVFCLRQTMDKVGESDSLWLEHEPSYEEVIDALGKQNMDDYNEVVFCGFGEPTERFDLLIKVAKYIKENYNKPIRINTNGQGNLINGRNIEPEMKGLIDTLSISLNTPDADRYYELVRSKFGRDAFFAMLDFARDAAKYVPNVVLTTVDTTLTKEEEAKCAGICKELGVTYRIRPWES